MHPIPSPDSASRDVILTSLAGLYSLRESMRQANKPVMVHCLTAAIKIRTDTLRAFDRERGTTGWGITPGRAKQG